MTVGTFHEMSPMSSEPPPRFSSSGIDSRPRSGLIFVARPISGTFISRCVALASAMSASLHCGNPTFSMFACIVSATVLLKCPGHADPSTFIADTSVSVIMAAALAMLLPISQSFLISS